MREFITILSELSKITGLWKSIMEQPLVEHSGKEGTRCRTMLGSLALSQPGRHVGRRYQIYFTEISKEPNVIVAQSGGSSPVTHRSRSWFFAEYADTVSYQHTGLLLQEGPYPGCQ